MLIEFVVRTERDTYPIVVKKDPCGLVSSARTRPADLSTSRARMVISPRLPMGVGTRISLDMQAEFSAYHVNE